MAGLGAGDYQNDPRTGRLDFGLARQQAGYRKRDKPKPKKPKIPKPALLLIQQWTTTGPREAALADLIWLAFFFLLRPGEYVWKTFEPHPFLLSDVTFKIATTAYSAVTILPDLLPLANYVGLHFTEQKMALRMKPSGSLEVRTPTYAPSSS
jgi:hypothetical protein